MIITEQQQGEIKLGFDSVCKFFARECVDIILNAIGEEKVQDNQGIYDCVHDMMIGVDLSSQVLAFLKERLEVK